jgi:hypothetical protein
MSMGRQRDHREGCAGGRSSRGTHADDCWIVILGNRTPGSTAGGEGRCGCGESSEESEKEMGWPYVAPIISGGDEDSGIGGGSGGGGGVDFGERAGR